MKNKYLAVTTALSTVAWASQAYAAGTPAGTAIANTAFVSYRVGASGERTVSSNEVAFVVDRLINFSVVKLRAGPQPLPVTPGQMKVAVPFRFTNSSNAAMSFRLTTYPGQSFPGGNFDLQNKEIWIDSNGNGRLDETQGENSGPDQRLAFGQTVLDGFLVNQLGFGPDQSLDFFVVGDVDVNTDPGTMDQVEVEVQAREPENSVGTSAVAGEPMVTTPQSSITEPFASVDTVLADPGGNGVERATDDLVANGAMMTVNISQVVGSFVAGYSGPTATIYSTPGAEVTYCVAANNFGNQSASEVFANAGIPAEADYVPGSLRTDVTVIESNPAYFNLRTCSGGTPQDDDAAGADDDLAQSPTAGNVDLVSALARFGWASIPAGEQRFGSFKVIIK